MGRVIVVSKGGDTPLVRGVLKGGRMPLLNVSEKLTESSGGARGQNAP